MKCMKPSPTMAALLKPKRPDIRTLGVGLKELPIRLVLMSCILCLVSIQSKLEDWGLDDAPFDLREVQ